MPTFSIPHNAVYCRQLATVIWRTCSQGHFHAGPYKRCLWLGHDALYRASDAQQSRIRELLIDSATHIYISPCALFQFVSYVMHMEARDGAFADVGDAVESYRCGWDRAFDTTDISHEREVMEVSA